MRTWVLFVAVGLFYALVPEVTNLVIINGTPSAFALAQVVYAIILTVFYKLSQMFPVYVHPARNTSVYIVIVGGIGLTLEWTLFGQSPAQNPDAIQWGMFVYWVGLAMIPRILIERGDVTRGVRKRLWCVLLAYTVVHLAVSLSAPVAILPVAVPIMWTVVYTAFFAYYAEYVRAHARARFLDATIL